MKNKSGFFRWGIAIGLLVLLVVCLLAGGLYYYFSQRAQSLDSRPLVLIHNPFNRDYVTVGDGIIVHATARSQAGLARMELWADDILVAEQEAPEGTEPVLLVLSAGWVPVDPGDHRLVVRAISVNDVEGQSTIALKALDTEEDKSSATHLVEQGETLETIAAGLGTSVEELADLNPGLDPGGLSAGDELVVPDDEPTREGGDEEAPTDNPLPESESEAPSAEGDPPGEMGLFLGPFMSGAEESDEPIGLQLELVSLSTGELYENLHCYVGLAGASPQWYPDRDSDQTTDESFSVSTWGFSDPGYSEIIDGSSSASRDGKKARTRWNIDEYLSGQAVPVLFWPSNLPIPFEISCVGISGGGTEALELGSLALSIEPDEWDGIVRRVEATDLEGSFTLGYRVGPVETLAGIAKEIDPDITAPTNLLTVNYHALFGPATGGEDSTFFVSENDPFTLLWNYNPGSDELPIEGFRIYLNGNLQWTERTDRQIDDNHYTVFPAEWRHPPCGEQYTLTVSAWRPGGIDGHESYPAEPAIVFETPADECQRYINITLLTLETFDIGGDGRFDNRDGDVGPPFGHFYANEEIITFDTGHPDDEIIPPGLNNDDILNLQNLSIPNWGLSGQLRWRAALDEYNTAVLGFEIWDEDTGDCRDAGDSGCPDLLCRGQEYLGDNDGRPYESEFDSSNGACKITFSVEMAAGSSSVSETSFGNTPEPFLKIENLTADERNRSTFQ
ncbi:MAG: LysM domain-containing protein, partial [Anaerolineales bacterium]|nr:LysM domain-containing protein [Anaerolineales bacterium]